MPDSQVGIVFSQKGGEKITQLLREQVDLLGQIETKQKALGLADTQAAGVFVANAQKKKRAAKEVADTIVQGAAKSGKDENKITDNTVRTNKQLRATAEAEIAATHAKYEKQKGESEIAAARRIGQEVQRIRKEFQANKITLAEEELSIIERKNIQSEQRRLSARQAVMTTVALQNDQIANHGAGAGFGILGVGRNVDKSFEKAGKSVLKYVGGLSALAATLGMSSAAEENAAVQTAAYGAAVMPVIGKVTAYIQAERAAAVAKNISTAAQIKLNLAFLANPITAVVAAVVALSVAFVALYNNSATIRNGISALWTSMKVLLGITSQSTTAFERQRIQMDKNAAKAREFAEDMRLLAIRSREASNLFDVQGQELEARVSEARNNAANARMIAETGMETEITKDANGNVVSMNSRAASEGTRAKMRMFAPMWEQRAAQAQAELDKFNSFKPKDADKAAKGGGGGRTKSGAGKDPLEIEREMMAQHRALMEQKARELAEMLERTYQSEREEQERFFAEEQQRLKNKLDLGQITEEQYAEEKLRLETQKNQILAELAEGREEELRRIDVNQKQAEAERDIAAYNRTIALARQEAEEKKRLAEEAARQAEERERDEVESWNNKAEAIRDISSRLASYLSIGTNADNAKAEEKRRYKEQLKDFRGNAIEEQKLEQEHQAKLTEIERAANEQRMNMLVTQVVPEIIKQLILVLAAAQPAAIANSIATFGAAAVTGLAAVMSAMGAFKEGGYTGDQGESEPAGVVHGKEVVIKAASVRKIGRSRLEYMNKFGSLPGYQAGGYVSPSGGGEYGSYSTILRGEQPGLTFNDCSSLETGVRNGRTYIQFPGGRQAFMNAVSGGPNSSGLTFNDCSSLETGALANGRRYIQFPGGRAGFMRAITRQSITDGMPLPDKYIINYESSGITDGMPYPQNITDGNPYSSLLNSRVATSRTSVSPDGQLLVAVQSLGARMDRAVDRINMIQIVQDRQQARNMVNGARGVSQRKSYGRKRG